VVVCGALFVPHPILRSTLDDMPSLCDVFWVKDRVMDSLIGPRLRSVSP
jgi:hypothetical protein